MDLSWLSDEQLRAVAQGDMSSLSNEELARLAGREQRQQDNDFSFMEMARNIPSSAANVVSGMAGAIVSPLDTANNVGRVIKGAGYKLNENLSDYLPEWTTDSGDQWAAENKQYEPYADAFGQVYADRYGSVDKAFNTLEQDPVGAGLDITGAGSLLGGATRMAGMGKTADAIRKTTAAINPINATMNASKYVGSKLVPKKAPGALYESAAKFGTTVQDRGKLIERALNEKLMPTERGAAKLQALISDAQSKVLSLIDDATSSGKTVPKGVVLRGIKQLKDGYRNTPEGDKAMAQIDEISKQFLLDDLGSKQSLTPADLQKWKVKAYDKINYNAKRNVDAPIKEEALKTTARAAKEAIEGVIPDADIKGMNARQGELLELQAPLQRSANRIANRNLISINAPLNMGAGSMIGSALDAFIPGSGSLIGAGAGGAASLLGSPTTKARMAIGLNNLKKTGDIKAFIRNNPWISEAEAAAYLSANANNSGRTANQ